MADIDLDKILGALDLGEKLMTGGKKAARLGALALDRVAQGKCAICGEEPAIEGMPIGPRCGKLHAGKLFDLLGRQG